ncbi:MAG: NADH-quinone oxidoreductase subunit J [Bacteroidota bacterium]
MTEYKIMFYLFAAMIIVFSLLTVTSRRILRAAVFLLFVLVSTAGLYFWLDYQFMAGVQLTLYAGGIVVLIIFSILLTSHIDQKFTKAHWTKKLLGATAALSGMGLCLLVLLQHKFIPGTNAAINNNMTEIGTQLLSTGHNGYALPFEVISILLLAAMIAAIIIAKKGK